MAAYAALVSVMHIIETLQNHPRPPISLDKEQLESLTQKITFLQKFLESHDGCEDSGELDGRIADAAYAAEDVIESHIVDQIEASSDNAHFSPAAGLFDGLNKVIQDLGLIQTDTGNFTKETRINDRLLHNENPMLPGGGGGQDTSSVGLEADLVKVMDKLTRGGHQSNRQIIPIVGMGGIGKSTLASNVYVNPVIVQHFDSRGWATISQEYNPKEIILEVLLCVKTVGGREGLSQKSEDELGVALHKSLIGRRYLIVLDDIWSIEAWNKVKAFFPDTNDGSAILLTTRLSNLAFQISGSYNDSLEMSFLDEGTSWNLFCKSTFGEDSCPRELEGIGKKIVENCKGLPLSIVVVGGVLAKSKRTREYWRYIAGNLSSIVNLKDNERCLKILHLSYRELPVHLKPCFLYMGVFPEDYEICIPKLMELWVAEGFLKPICGKCLEEVAKEYFDDLLGRNLVLVGKKGKSGQPKSCKIHDLLKDICVREAQKHNIYTQRHIVVRELPSHRTLVRSVTFTKFHGFSNDFNFGLVRVWNKLNENFGIWPADIAPLLVNCRYLSKLHIDGNPRQIQGYPGHILYSLCSLWNLQRLHVDLGGIFATCEIWKMSQLRHVNVKTLMLLEPPLTNGRDDEFVLRNLHKLSFVHNFKFTEEVVKRIPNIKKLGTTYAGIVDWSSCCLGNLVQLIKLESLLFSCARGTSVMHENLNFPRSLKKLTLCGTNLEFRDLGPRVGSLPHLQVLKLQRGSFVGPEWETVEGQFSSLRHLDISGLSLICWNTESCTHFPCLERLVLWDLHKLKEIPSEIGETIKSIEMWYCSDSSVISAREIVKEQEELGNQGIHLKVEFHHKVINNIFLPKPYLPPCSADNTAPHGFREKTLRDFKARFLLSDQVQQFERDINTIHSFLEAADRWSDQYSATSLRRWISDLEELGRKADDVLGRYHHLESSKRRRFLGIFRGCFCTPPNMHRVGSDIMSIRAEVERLSAKATTFSLGGSSSCAPAAGQQNLRLTYEVVEKERHFVGASSSSDSWT